MNTLEKFDEVLRTCFMLLRTMQRSIPKTTCELQRRRFLNKMTHIL